MDNEILDKIFCFDKKEREESELYSRFEDIISSIGAEVLDEDNDSESVKIFDSIATLIFSEEFQGKITLAGFNKLLKKYDIFIDDNIFSQILEIIDIGEYSNSYLNLVNCVYNSNNGEMKKIDFLSMILLNNFKYLFFKSKSISANNFQDLIKGFNKFIVLCIFKYWKDNGYINSSIVDDIRAQNVSSRVISTMKTAIKNLISKFNDENYISCKNTIDGIRTSTTLIVPNNKNSILNSCDIRVQINLYDKYRGAISFINSECFSSPRVRMSTYTNADRELFKNISSSFGEIYFPNQYSYSFALNGSFQFIYNFITTNSQNILNGTYNNYGLLSLTNDSINNVKKIEKLDNDIESLYYNFGYSKDQDYDFKNSVVYKMFQLRNNSYINMSLEDIITLPFSTHTCRQHGFSAKYVGINMFMNRIIGDLKLIVCDLGIDNINTKSVNIFMPFVYFILDMNQIVDESSGDYGVLLKYLFILNESYESIEEKYAHIVSNWTYKIDQIQDEENIRLEVYRDFSLSKICAVYNAYLSKIDFDISEDFKTNKYMFLIHFNEFMMNIVNSVNEHYAVSDKDNIWDLSIYTYLNEALKIKGIIVDE